MPDTAKTIEKVEEAAEAYGTPKAAPQNSAKPVVNAGNAKRKRLLTYLGIAVVIGAVAYGAYYGLVASHYVSTDNAYVGTDTAQVNALVSGPVASISVSETQAVKAGDILLTIDDADARIAVAQAQAALGTASTLLDQTSVVAPFDGVIAQKLLDVGASASPAAPIFVISARAVEVRLTVEEARIALVKPDLPADLTVAAFPGKKFTGQVSSVAPTGDARAHTFEVKVIGVL